MILTDASGRPFERPAREDFNSDTAFIAAHHAWRDCVTREANSAFDEQFRKSLSPKDPAMSDEDALKRSMVSRWLANAVVAMNSTAQTALEIYLSYPAEWFSESTHEMMEKVANIGAMNEEVGRLVPKQDVSNFRPGREPSGEQALAGLKDGSIELDTLHRPTLVAVCWLLGFDEEQTRGQPVAQLRVMVKSNGPGSVVSKLNTAIAKNPLALKLAPRPQLPLPGAARPFRLPGR